MKTEIKRWGNSAAVRLPAKILAMAHLEIDSPIRILVDGEKIILEPTTDSPDRKRLKLPFSESALLSGLTPENAHADELAEPSSIELGD